jgi:hypothetical protein
MLTSYMADGAEVLIDPSNNANYWCSGRHYLSPTYYMCVGKSTNAGGTWTYSDLDTVYSYSNGLAIDPNNTATLYSVGYPNVYKTTNSGSAWNKMSPGLTSTMYDVVVDPSLSNRVYAGRYNGLYRSTDGGYNWASAGTWSNATYAVLIDPDDNNTIYAGTATGIWRTTNGGSSWNAMNDGLEDTYVTSLGIYPDNYLLAGTQGGGMYRWSLAVGIKEMDEKVTSVLSLVAQPNPCRGKTTISFTLPKESLVSLKIYDTQGRYVDELMHGPHGPGQYEVLWSGLDQNKVACPAGIYFCRLEAGAQTITQKLLLIR